MIKPEEAKQHQLINWNFNFTLNNSQKNDDNEKEESYIKHYPVRFIVVSIWWFNLVTNTTTSSNSFIQVKHETLQIWMFKKKTN